MPRKVAIGIDLGTTHSRVAAYRSGRVEIIANEKGSRITPSCVAFSNNRRLIGAAAANQAGVNPSNTIIEAKRLIGRKFTDPIVQRDIMKWPFVVFNSNETPKYKVQYKSEDKIITPELISAMVLNEMKEIAETFLDEEVSDAVITVPAYFTNSQRQATKDAGEIAGLNVLKIINEPTAAAIAFSFDKEVTSKRNILIYDLGGGTFDVAVLSVAGGVFDVKAVGGDTHLGGGDFDDRLIKHFLKKISKIHKVDLSSDQRALIRLRCACESAKQQLSSTLETKIEMTGLFDRKDFMSSISRARFEDLCSDLFQQTMKHVSTTLDDSGLSKDDIHEVVLVGGSTRIKKIQQLLRNFFNGKELNKTINPDEAVVYGAAIEAAILSGDNTVEEVKLLDVTPLTLVVRKLGGTGTHVIKRSTKIPAKRTVHRTTPIDYQTWCVYSIYEGNDTCCENNHLGKFELDNIAYARAGVPDFDLSYEIDENGILHAFAIDLKTSCANRIVISNKSSLQRNEIDQMIAEVEEFNRIDLELSRRDRAREILEKYCFDALDVLDKAGDGSSDTLREAVRSECEKIREWIDLNRDADEQEYFELLEDAKEFCEEKLVLIMISCVSNTVRLFKTLLS